MAALPIAFSPSRNARANGGKNIEPWLAFICRYCNFTRMNSQELCDHYLREHQIAMAEDDLMDADWAFPNVMEGNVLCLECYTKVPRSLLEIHSTQHKHGIRIKEESDAGRGGRAELPESFQVQAYPIKGAQPVHKFLGDLPESASLTTALPQAFWNAGDSSAERKRSIEDLKNNDGRYRQRRKKGQLGMESLGPWAFEEQMPQHIRDILAKDGKPRVHHRRLSIVNLLSPSKKGGVDQEDGNFASGVIPVIGQLLAKSTRTSYAYLCDPAVVHVHKMHKEGAFCGYRNTQMFCSYILNKKARGWDLLGGRIPSIFDIQEYIEEAWDNGFNVNGRIETGGVRGTRKYIGTPEVEAMMNLLDVEIITRRFKSDCYHPGYKKVLPAIERYFSQSWVADSIGAKPKVRMTSSPPIYFQHNGHSFTVIGFERLSDGTSQLLAFDPALTDEQNIIAYVRKGVPERMMSSLVEHCLQNYRKSPRYLQKHKIFEILVLKRYVADTPPADIDAPHIDPQRPLASGNFADSRSLEEAAYDLDDTL